MKAVVVIPARYQSSRFPGKPLVSLNGKTLIQRVVESAAKVQGVAGVYVATDDDRIKSHVESFGGNVLMTPESCQNGTERVAAAAGMLPNDIDVFINWQGDSPLTPPSYPQSLMQRLQETRGAELVTPVVKCDEAIFMNLKADRDAKRVGGTMAVISCSQRALYFSKEMVPYSDKVGAADAAFYFHVGMYGYRRDVLLAYPSWPVGPLEKIEGLEQLRFLENDRYVDTAIVEGRGHWEVNNPEDVPLVERLLKEHGID
ncbi:MAG: 3-deoxy-manno-octulosonate cytidylyltransferase [Bdellovibrionales bacterium]